MITKLAAAAAISLIPMPMQCAPEPLPPSCSSIVIDRRVWPEKGIVACDGPSGWVKVDLLCMEAPVPIGSGETRDLQWHNGPTTYHVGPERTYHSAQCTKLFPHVYGIYPSSWA